MPVRPNTYVTAINFSSSGDNIIVSHPAAGPIHVYGIIFTVAGATNITFKNGTTAQSGPVVFTGNGSSMTVPVNNYPIFWTDPGNDFVMNSSNAVQVSGSLYYTTG